MRLTDTEQRVYDAVVKGRRNKQIAHDLGVTERTIKAHRAAIMRKTGAKSLAALIRMAIEGGQKMDWKFNEGDYVRKVGGYPFPGIVEARFRLTQHDGTKVERYVVNQIATFDDGNIGPIGLGHIFSPEQLKPMERPERLRLPPEGKPVSSDLLGAG